MPLNKNSWLKSKTVERFNKYLRLFNPKVISVIRAESLYYQKKKKINSEMYKLRKKMTRPTLLRFISSPLLSPEIEQGWQILIRKL